MPKFFRLRPLDQQTVAFTLAISVATLCWYTVTDRRGTFEPQSYRFHIDLNTATHGELQTLSGIGPKLAENIVQYRDQHAPILDFGEILNVKGIGIKRYNAIKHYFIE